MFAELPIRTMSLLALVLVAVSPNMPAKAQTGEPSLYERVGGYDVLAAFVDDFMVRFDEDPELVPYLGGINAAAGARIRQHFVDYMCAISGGPCLYNGRAMPTAHDGLRIASSHFEAVMAHMKDALDAQDVAIRERDELLAMLQTLKSQIVSGRHRPSPSDPG